MAGLSTHMPKTMNTITAWLIFRDNFDPMYIFTFGCILPHQKQKCYVMGIKKLSEENQLSTKEVKENKCKKICPPYFT